MDSISGLPDIVDSLGLIRHVPSNALCADTDTDITHTQNNRTKCHRFVFIAPSSNRLRLTPICRTYLAIGSGVNQYCFSRRKSATFNELCDSPLAAWKK